MNFGIDTLRNLAIPTKIYVALAAINVITGWMKSDKDDQVAVTLSNVAIAVVVAWLIQSMWNSGMEGLAWIAAIGLPAFITIMLTVGLGKVFGGIFS